MNPETPENAKWQRSIERERQARKAAERMLKEKTLALHRANKKIGEQANNELKRRQKQYRSLFDFTLDGIVIHELDGEILETNPEFSNLIGQSRKRLKGLNIREFFCPFEARRFENFLTDLTDFGACRFETLMRRIDAQEFPVEISCSLIEIGGRNVVQGFVRDVSRRNKMIESLKEAKNEAERSNLAKSRFLANMSHEIRTPMNGIIGVADLLRETELTSEQRELASTILISGESLLEIINQILDFSKIESGSMELEAMPFSLSDCVESALAGVRGLASAKELELIGYIDPAIWDGYYGDIVRLRQVIINLLGNAVKFTDKGEVELCITSRESTAEGYAGLRLSVRDTGIGIPADQTQDIFDKFTQVDTSTTRIYGGTGLGLSITKHIVEEMGGSIEVESELGEGTVFHIDLQLPIDKEAAPYLDDADFSGYKVLLVEDNHTNLAVLSSQCEYLGMDVVVFDCAMDALDTLKAHPQQFDLALIDMMMPRLSGLALIREFRKMESFSKTPMILASSLGHLPSDASGERTFDEFVSKPVMLGPLKKAIQSASREQIQKRSVQSHHMPSTEVGLRVLLAEDNPINLRVAGKMLNQLGHEQEVATTGLQVVNRLQNGETYDVILMDVEMPEMDGVEATAKIRELFPNPKFRPKIVALTANAIKGDRERFIDAGMDDYISKPVRKDKLKEVIDRVLEEEIG